MFNFKNNIPDLKYREIKKFINNYNGIGLVTVNSWVTGTAELKYKS